MAYNKQRGIEDLLIDLARLDALDGIVNLVRRARSIISEINVLACSQGNNKLNVACGDLQDNLSDLLRELQLFPSEAAIALSDAKQGAGEHE